MENVNAEPLLVALTFDAEADVFDASFGGVATALPSWRGIEEGIPRIDEVLQACTAARGLVPRATWYVRCDRQIGALFGNPAHLLEKYRRCWAERVARGDEIGFHPHLYRHTNSAWRQETDAVALREQMAEALAAIRRLDFAPASSRIGEAFGSDAVMAALDEFGFRCDSTAMPGRVRRDAERQLDWGATPPRPYHPSVADYRVPGLPSRRMLEVPMSMIRTRADYDRAPLLRYVDLSFHHAAIRDGLRDYLRETPLLVTVTHPSTVLSGIAQKRHGLVSFELGEFRRNLEFVLIECERLGREVQFITIGECAEMFNSTPTSRVLVTTE